jgi:hypothetical protein
MSLLSEKATFFRCSGWRPAAGDAAHGASPWRRNCALRARFQEISLRFSIGGRGSFDGSSDPAGWTMADDED